MGERRDIFKREREKAILETLTKTHSGASFEEIEEAKKRAEHEAIQRVGEKSERRFLYYSKNLKRIVERVRPGSFDDDYYNSTDAWLKLSQKFNLPQELPVQVKSSYKDARIFKFGDPDTGREPNKNFIKRNGVMIVVNCGPSVKQRDLKKQFLDEIRRIQGMLGIESTPQR
jgi:hypothetical protein